MNAFSKPMPSRTGTVAIYLFLAAQVIRTLTDEGIQDQLHWYLGLMLAYVILFTAVFWRPHLPPRLVHLYLMVQSAIILGLLSLDPELDHVTAFFLPLSYQAAFFFAGRTLWTWVGMLALLIDGSLMFYHGLLEGLALGLTTIAAVIVIPAFVVVNQEIEIARAKSEAMIKELQATRARLEAYANQVEELAAIEERTRLARELHDSVSQTIFSITLNARTTQILQERNPAQVKPQLEQLQVLTQNALAQMRSLIAELRPQSD
jgi:signal transduction histidine kinase